jgi:MFS family permease
MPCGRGSGCSWSACWGGRRWGPGCSASWPPARLGCVVAGLAADRWNRARVAALCMLVSGGCALVIGPAAAWPALALGVAFVWGFAVVADSAQFSACVVSLSPPDYVGTMLTVQTSMGFLLTAVVIGALPHAMALLSPGLAFALLGIGPLLGAIAMWRLAPMLDQALVAEVGGRVDFHEAVRRAEAGDDAGHAMRRVVLEVREIDVVHRLPIRPVRHVDGALHDIVQRAARFPRSACGCCRWPAGSARAHPRWRTFLPGRGR